MATRTWRNRLEALLANTPTFRVTLGTLYREYPQLPRPLGKLARRNAAVWLRSVLSLPLVLGYNGLVVLFDETEAALRSTRPWSSLSRRQQAHLAHIRTFVDHMATGAFRGCAIYYAVTEEFIEIARQEPRGAESADRTHPAARAGRGLQPARGLGEYRRID